MRILLLVCISFLTSVSVQAQKVTHSSDNAEVYFGPQQERQEGEAVAQFIAEFDDGFLLYRRNRESFGFEYRDLELEVVRKGKVSVPKVKGKVKQAYDFIQTGNRVFMLFATTEKKEKRNILYLQELDLESLKLKDSPRQLAKIEGKEFYGNFKKAFPQTAISPDGSKVMIAFKQPKSEDKSHNYWFMVFDKNMNEIWQSSINLAMGDGKLHVGGMHRRGQVIDRSVMGLKRMLPGGMNAFEVDNNGRVNAWAEYWDPDMEKAGKNEAQEIRLYFLRILEDGLTTRNFYLPTEDEKLIDPKTLGIFYQENGDIVVTGYYSNSVEKKEMAKILIGVNGVFHMVYDFDNEQIKEHIFNEFGSDFITKYLWDRSRFGKKSGTNGGLGTGGGIPNLTLRIHDNLEDGSLLLMGEVYYVKSYRDDKGRVSYEYASINIYLTYLNADGSVAWNRVVPKFQERDHGPAGHGFVAILNGYKLHLLYNDNYKNVEADWDGKTVFKFLTGNSVTLATIDLKKPDSMTREQVFNAESLGGSMFMLKTLGKQINPNTYMMYVKGGRGMERFVKLEMK
ncbi:MAG: hypothetical protein JKX84_04960 [Flavobacteriales bacterium]|nr:hypothetical protein [Flavobacteriales bacterium]